MEICLISTYRQNKFLPQKHSFPGESRFPWSDASDLFDKVGAFVCGPAQQEPHCRGVGKVRRVVRRASKAVDAFESFVCLSQQVVSALELCPNR